MADSASIYIIAPGGFQSGGPELVHQLCHNLRQKGIDAKMVYAPFFRSFDVPERFRKYDVRVGKVSDIAPGDSVVLPEVYSGYIKRFKHQRVFFWWMSVDFYFSSNNWKYALRSGMLPWNFHDISRKPFPSQVEKHLVQSKYAKDFLESHNIFNIETLSDYLNDDYLSEKGVQYIEKQDMVVYNPSKGWEFTEKIIAALPETTFIPIKNMTRDEVIGLLRRAKVYIDFGNHPGKDRIPREAAMLGCCVITNRRGSAANSADVPIDSAYKIDDSDPNFASIAAAKISQTIQHFDTRKYDFDQYRNFIRSEPALFNDDIDRIFVIDNPQSE
jgi:hypothetical protein